MKIIGYVARDASGKYAHPYGELGSIKLYLKEGSARQYNKKAEILPVFVQEPSAKGCTCRRNATSLGCPLHDEVSRKSP